MNWQALTRHFDQQFDFFSRISVTGSPDQQGVSVHPIVKLSTGLTLKTINASQTNRLVILLPNRLESARWIAIFATLEMMRTDYRENSADNIEFTRGQKLLVENCVVEYEREEFCSYMNRQVMWVKCSDGRWAVPVDRKLEFQPTTTKRPLSSLRRIRDTCRPTEVSDEQLDHILGIKSLGNRSVFTRNVILVSKIGISTDFIQEHYINKSKIIDLFQWGKLDVNGKVTVLTSGQAAATPSCLIASDLFSVAEYVVGNPQRIKGIIIDGIASCLRDIQRLDDDLLNRGIPVIVVADFFDTESLHHLEERDFRIWQWNSDNISQSKSITTTSKESPFASLNRSLRNYAHQQIVVKLCEHPQLTKIVKNTMELDETIKSSEDDQLQRLYGKLMGLVNRLSRMIWLPERNWTATFRQRVPRLRADIASRRLWLTTDSFQKLDTILHDLNDLSDNLFPDRNHKLDKLRHLLNDPSSSGTSAVIVPTASDAEAARRYWQSEMASHELHRVHFWAPPDLQQLGKTLSLTRIIICGWLNYKKMYPLLHSYLAPEVTMLLYPFEAEWFRSVQKRWRRQNSYTIRAEAFSDLLEFPEKNLNFVNYVPREDSPSERDVVDIIGFELNLQRYKYSGYAAVNDSKEDIVKAKIVVFTQSRFAFITETHRLLVVTDLMRGKSSGGKIPRKDIDQLQIGDYVLFRESDRDIIREIADRALAKQNLSHLRQSAGLWREALQTKYEEIGRDLDVLTLLLWEAGCKRKQSTIKNWLFDDDQIGPASQRDLERMVNVTGNSQLKENMQEVVNAIRVVRGAHLQAANYITHRLLSNLPEILDSEQETDTGSRRSVTLDLEDFGQVMILRIEEIGDDWKEYEHKWVNRLLTQEDD